MSADSDDDDGLLRRAGQGDRAAFVTLMQRHADHVHALALRVLNSAADAEEATQEVFVKLWQTAHRWQPGRAKVSTWLYRVTLNHCLNWRDRQQRRHQGLDTAMTVIDPAPGPEAHTAAAQQWDTVEAAVAALPDSQRAAVALVYANDLSNREAAAVMEISVKAFEALLVRARRQLRARLARHDEDDDDGH